MLLYKIIKMVVTKSTEADSDLIIESSPEVAVKEELAEVNKPKITDGMCFLFLTTFHNFRC